MKIPLKFLFISINFLPLFFTSGCSPEKGEPGNAGLSTTMVTVTIPANPADINPMIYGQMFEDCNDRVIYDGIVGLNGEPRPHVDELLKALQIPIIRWPGGTFVHEYRWERGIGPGDKRPVVDVQCWGGIENHRFGTDEFLQWCDRMKVEPYINFNMANNPDIGGTVQEALNWIEYTNGAADTPYGQKRAQNGHSEPYGVKFWCIGNENWGGFGINKKETGEEYALRLKEWASVIREKHPDLQLLAVGHTYEWDRSVLEHNLPLIDILTQHYYVHTPVRNDSIVSAANSLFAPVKMEAHLARLGTLLSEYNARPERAGRPITLSIDEWNNRHQLFDGEKFTFTRNDLRRQFDVAVTAGMLNAFIRQSPHVSMGNYIFPVNGHGLVRTVGDNDAFLTPTYYLFQLYRELMTGKRLDIQVEGPGVSTASLDFSIQGDASEIKLDAQTLPFIDGAAVLAEDGSLNLAFANRSHDTSQEIKLAVPNGYKAVRKWEITYPDINAFNDSANRDRILPREDTLTKKTVNFDIPPCGWMLIQLKAE